MVERLRQGQLQYSIAKEFQSLVVLGGLLLLVRQARMGERFVEQCRLTKRIAENAFQGIHAMSCLSWEVVYTRADRFGKDFKTLEEVG